MTIGERLKQLRQELGLSQEAFGAQGFVSTPGWIKIENGTRSPSEKMIASLIRFLIAEKYMKAGVANALKEDLLTLKYLGGTSPFVRELAKTHAKTLPNGSTLIESSGKPKPQRGRPKVG